MRFVCHIYIHTVYNQTFELFFPPRFFFFFFFGFPLNTASAFDLGARSLDWPCNDGQMNTRRKKHAKRRVFGRKIPRFLCEGSKMNARFFHGFFH